MLAAFKLSSRSVQKVLSARYFSKSAYMMAAMAFDMPSMSPTMETGNIVEWKVKPGQAYKAGDVLLDIETDKAEISVEANEDGVLARILALNGTKDIPVGKPIAVTADQGDDLTGIDYAKFAGDNAAPAPASEQPQQDPQPAAAKSEAATNSDASSGTLGQGDLPPLPSVARLSSLTNIPIDSVHGTGFKGRVTKGDMLAKAGKIPASYIAEEALRIQKLTQLDLCGVAKPSASENAKPEREPEPELAKHLTTKEQIPLTLDSAKLVEEAKRSALRAVLMSRWPKPSALRDPILDVLTRDTTVPFEITKFETQIVRGKPVHLELEITEPYKENASKEVLLFIEHFKAKL